MHNFVFNLNVVKYSAPDDDQLRDYLHQADLLHLIDRTGGLDVAVEWNWFA
jgi:hypothetical protein